MFSVKFVSNKLAREYLEQKGNEPMRVMTSFIVFAALAALAAGVAIERHDEDKIIVDLDLCWKGVGYQVWNDNTGEWECFMTSSEYERVR